MPHSHPGERMARTLIDPRFEHDACGVGFIAARDRVPSYRLTHLAVECVQRLDHRGARAADGTGDGAGLLTQIPQKLMRRELASHGLAIEPGRLGVVMCFLPPMDAATSRSIVSEALEVEGLRVMFWRSVPIDPSVLGEHARAVLPLVEQAVVTGDARATNSIGRYTSPENGWSETPTRDSLSRRRPVVRWSTRVCSPPATLATSTGIWVTRTSNRPRRLRPSLRRSRSRCRRRPQIALGGS